MGRLILSVLFLLGACAATAQESLPPLESLIQELQEGGKQERRDAARLLATMGPEAAPATAALVKGLRDDDTQVWFHSVTALANIGPAAGMEAVPALIRGFDDGSRYEEQVRFRSAHALARMGAKVIPALKETMKSSDPEDRLGVCMSLGGMGEDAKAALDLLEHALSDQQDFVRVGAAEALGALQELSIPVLSRSLRSDNPIVVESSAMAVYKLGEAGKKLGSDLMKVFSKQKVVLTQVALLHAMAAVGVPASEMAPLVTGALLSKEVPLRDAAFDSLLYLREDPAPVLQILKQWLLEGADQRRNLACEALAVLGESARPVVPQLMSVAIKVSDHGEQPWATNALVRVGKASVRPLLGIAESLQEPAVGDEWWIASVSSIGPQGLPQVQGMLKSDKPTARHASLVVIDGMGVFGKPTLRAVQKALSDQVPYVRAAALKALYSVGTDNETMLTSVGRFLRTGDTVLQVAAAKVVQRMEEGASLVVEDLLDALDNEDATCRLELVRALGAVGRGAGSAVGRLGELAGKSKPDLQREILSAFASIGPESTAALPVTMKLLEGGDQDLVLAALEALAQSGTSAYEATPAIEKLYEQGDASMKAVALPTLVRIAKDRLQQRDRILEALASDSVELRHATIETLGELRIKMEPVNEKLVTMLENKEDQEEVISTLRRINPRSLDLLVKTLDSKDPRVRLYGVEAITGIGRSAKELAPRIREMAGDPDEYVARAARRGIRRLE